MRRAYRLTVRVLAGTSAVMLLTAGVYLSYFWTTLREYRLSPDQEALTLPADFPQPEFAVYDEPTPGTLYMEAMLLSLSLPELVTQSHWAYIFEVDPTRQQVTYARKTASTGFQYKRLNDERLAYYVFNPLKHVLKVAKLRGGGVFGVEGGYYRVLDNDYREVDRIAPRPDADIHELLLLENGNYMYFQTKRHWNAQPGTGCGARCAIVVQQVVEQTPSGEVVFEWDAYPHYDYALDSLPETIRYQQLGVPSIELVDLTHMNNIDIDANGDLLLSSRHFDEVIKVDRETGEVLWRLGGKRSIDNEFTFINDPYDGFALQHTPYFLENGNLLVYDNGDVNHPARAVEYELDIPNRTATLVWSYEHPDDALILERGSAVRLPSGNTLINWVEEQPNVVEVTPEGDVVWEMTLPDGYASYQVNYWQPDGTASAANR